MAKATYRSALRSRRMLREALAELLAEKDYDSITVADVTRRADLNRGTFYAHYANVDELAQEMYGSVTAKALEFADETLEHSFYDDPTPTLDRLGEFFESDAVLYRNLLASRGADAFIESLRTSIRAHILAQPCLADKRTDMGVLAQTDFVSGGLISIYRSWLTGAYGDAGIDVVTQQASRLIRTIG